MVQLQAMSCGLPVICTPNSRGDEIIHDGKDGYILPIRNLKELKQRIRFYIIINQSVKKWGKLLKLKLRNIFLGNHMEKMLFQFIKIY